MACKGCGNKKSQRYSKNIRIHQQSQPSDEDRVKDMVGKPTERPSKSHQTPDSFSEVVERAKQNARQMDYKELKERKEQHIFLARAAADEDLSTSTMAMKRLYLEELVSIWNGEEVVPSGTTPHNALRLLKELLSRTDFDFINTLYPELKRQVDEKYKELEKNKIFLR